MARRAAASVVTASSTPDSRTGRRGEAIRSTYPEASVADNDRDQIDRLIASAPGAAIARVPFFDRDVYDIDGLSLVTGHLLAA